MKTKKSLKERLMEIKDYPPMDRTGIIGAVDEGLVYKYKNKLYVVNPDDYKIVIED